MNIPGVGKAAANAAARMMRRAAPVRMAGEALTHSAEHIGVNAAAHGMGGWAGPAIGGAAGAILGPWGVVAGASLGSVTTRPVQRALWSGTKAIGRALPSIGAFSAGLAFHTAKGIGMDMVIGGTVLAGAAYSAGKAFVHGPQRGPFAGPLYKADKTYGYRSHPRLMMAATGAMAAAMGVKTALTYPSSKESRYARSDEGDVTGQMVIDSARSARRRY